MAAQGFFGDTIAALATAPAPAGVAIVRVSGPACAQIARDFFHASQSPLESPRSLVFGKMRNPKTREHIDSGLLVYMPGPNSFTGEDVLEFHLHGNPRIAEKLLNALFVFGVRPAQAGEFTRRAFENGRMDLAQAESLADLIAASGDEALRIAQEQLSGTLSDALRLLGEPLRDALAEIEASLDFPEEEILPETSEILARKLFEVEQRIEAYLKSYAYGAKVKEGFRVLLCGAPNVGKSSLLNALLGKARALVSPISGTTRDLIEEEAIYDGYRFIFCDSAGIHESGDTVEQMGMELARERISWADLVLLVRDVQDNEGHWKAVLKELQGKAAAIWLVTCKSDLLNEQDWQGCGQGPWEREFLVSTQTGAGLPDLRNALTQKIAESAKLHGELSCAITNERHKAALEIAGQSLGEARSLLLQQGTALELVSAEIRHALGALGEIVGETFTEDILGRIFSRFCIGK